MNKKQIYQNELSKIKSLKVQAELKARDNLISARKIPEFCKIDNEMRTLKLEFSKQNDATKIKELKQKISALQKQADKILLANKIKPSSLLPNYSCKNCNDNGFIKDKPCECLKKAVQQELIKQCGINNHLNFTFKDSDNEILSSNADLTRNYKLANKFVQEFPNFVYPNLIFLGDVGTGKTFLLECIANELLQKMHYVVFSTAFELNQTMIKSFSTSPLERDSLLSPFFESELLIIDDLGSEPILRNTTISSLYTIIDERQRLNLPTIISTNLSPEEIQDRYGERVMSRLFNKRISLIVKFSGKDLRLN